MGRGRPKLDDGHRVKINLTLARETIDKLDAILYADQVSRSQTVDEAVSALFEKLESERGQPYPRR